MGQGLVQGPSAQFRARGSIEGPGARFGAQVLTLRPGARFRAHVLDLGPRCLVRGWVQGPDARFEAQVLGSGPRCSVQGPGAWASTSGSTGEHCQALYLTRAALGYYRLKVYKKFFLLTTHYLNAAC